MTQNKIIAEFMDWTEDFDSITHEGNKWWSDPNTHKYHTSWDWLMPVVIKCFEVDDSVNDDLNFKLNDALLETNIDSLYKVVVEFIKTITLYNMKYNENSDLFYDKYKPVYNHLENKDYYQGQTEGNEIGSAMYFETYGDDLEFVKIHDDKFIWTLIEVDDKQYISQGFHYVNRLNYLIASEPYEKGQREFLDYDFNNIY